MDPEAAELFKAAFGEPGEPVPTVDVEDLKKMWAFTEEGRRSNKATGLHAYAGPRQQICSPGADERAVSYRCTMLGLMEMIFRRMWSGGGWSDASFKAAANMEMKWMAVGVVYNGGEVLEKFFEEVQKAAA
jgi:hypothetical protein